MLVTSDDPFPDDPLKIGEAAALVRVCKRSLSRRVQRGQLRAWRDRVSGQLRVSKADVLAMWRAVAAAPGKGKRGPSAARREREKAEADAWVRERLGL